MSWISQWERVPYDPDAPPDAPKWRKKEKDPKDIIDETTSKHLIPGAILVNKVLSREVILEPDNTIVKLGPGMHQSEVEALKVAADAGISAPRLIETLTKDGTLAIRMSHIPGQTLEKVWPDLSAEGKEAIARQLHDIVGKMRELEPSDYIGSCDRSGVRDTRIFFTHDSPICHTVAEFNEYLLSSLFKQIPPALRDSFRGYLGTDHRVVFTHGDLAPRNIMIQDGRISGIVDWEEAGWYPEYWEVVKFFERPAAHEWKTYAGMIFPKLYSAELVAYTGMSKWRSQ